MFRLLFFIISFNFTLYAKVTYLCNVSYFTHSGWSNEKVSEVSFYSGKELNKSTGTFDYDQSHCYAAIWFSQSNVAILEVRSNGFKSYGSSFTKSDFLKLFGSFMTKHIGCIQKNDKQKRKWQIKAKKSNLYKDEWIDPRLN